MVAFKGNSWHIKTVLDTVCLCILQVHWMFSSPWATQVTPQGSTQPRRQSPATQPSQHLNVFVASLQFEVIVRILHQTFAREYVWHGYRQDYEDPVEKISTSYNIKEINMKDGWRANQQCAEGGDQLIPWIARGAQIERFCHAGLQKNAANSKYDS